MKHLSVLLIIFVSFHLYSQEITYSKDTQMNSLIRTVKLAKSLQDVHPLDSLFNTSTLSSPKYRTTLLLEKATLLTDIYHLLDGESDQDSLEYQCGLKEVLDCYNQAVINSGCSYITYSIFSRKQFIGSLMYAHDDLDDSIVALYRKDLEYIKSKGYKPQRDGFGAGAYFVKGKETYLGIEFSFYSFYEHENHIFSDCDSIVYGWKLTNFPKAVNAITLSYSHSFKGVSDISVSLIDLASPVLFSPLKIGYSFGPELNPGIYYRPTIGLPIFGFISVSYSYNFMLSKKARENSEKSLLMLKVAYPITSHRNRNTDK